MGTWMWALGKTVHALWCNRLSCFIVVFSGCRSLLFMPIEMIKCLTCGCGEVRCMDVDAPVWCEVDGQGVPL